MRSHRALRLTAALLLLLLPLEIAPEGVLPSREAPIVALGKPPAAAPRPLHARLSPPYDAREIEARLQASRYSIAGCFLRDRSYPAGRVKVTIGWEGSGLLHSLKLSPEGTETTRQCLEGVVGHWSLKPHPALQPFVYRATLVLD